MSSFDMSDIAAATPLASVTNGPGQGGGAPINGEQHTKMRELGWVEPKANDYTSTAPTGVLATVEEEGQETEGTSIEATGWAHNARKYEWKEDYGDVGPRDPQLEKELYHEHGNSPGEKFENLKIVKVTVESENRVQPVSSFKDAGLHPIMVENIEMCGYHHTTPIQAYTIPAVLTNHDVIGIAQTGSGKTAAFMIPTISKLMGKAKKLAAARPSPFNFDPSANGVRAEPLVLIVAPTRELCCQIFDEARRLCYRSMLRPCVAYGGAPLRDQIAQLRRGCDILVASPGRLLDIMGRPEVLSLSRVRYTIIDEADEMLGDDWGEEIAQIMGGGDANTDGDHRYLLFSATFPKRVRKLAAKYLGADHIHVSVGRSGSVHVNVKQTLMWVNGDKKMQALYDLLLSMPPSRTLVFVRTKKTADFVDDYLYNMGMPSTSIHADRSQSERESALRDFKAGRSPILVATGVTARGLDVRNVMHVINFDLPFAEYGGKEEYVHRIGRTARIGNEGLATSFYNEKDEALAPFLARILLETNQVIPDFLTSFKPEEGIELTFDDLDEAGAEYAAGGYGGDGPGWGNEDAGDATAGNDQGGDAGSAAPAQGEWNGIPDAAPSQAW